jgi:hypothetical protein
MQTLSNRPGRSSAESMMSGRLVAATTNTSPLSPTPFNSVSNWLTTRSVTPDPPLDWFPLHHRKDTHHPNHHTTHRSTTDYRLGANASSSSKNTTQGADARARSNTVLTALSLSPTYLSSSSGPLTEMKFARDSLAIAFATSVLPHPGGPYSNTPTAGFTPNDIKLQMKHVN